MRLTCTAAGTVTFTLLDGSSETYAAVVGYQVVPFAATLISAATATCSYASLK